MSIFPQEFNIIIEHGISAPGHGREVVDSCDATEKQFIFNLMATVQLPGSQRVDIKMEMHTSTLTDDISLLKKIKKHLSNASRQHGILDYGKQKSSRKQIGKQRLSCAKRWICWSSIC